MHVILWVSKWLSDRPPDNPNMATMDDRVSRANSTASVFINPMTALVSLPDLADSLRATPIATSASDVSPWGLLSRSNSASLIRSSGSLITTFSHSGLLRGSQALRDSDGLVPEAAFLSTATPESRSRNGSWSAVESALILGAPTRQVSHIELVREGRCDVAADPVPVKHLAKNRATRKSESQAMVKQVGLRAQNGGKGKRASEPSFKPPIRLGAETPTRQENGTSRENSVLEAVDNARSRRNSMHQELKSRRQSSKPTIKPASTKTGTKSVQLRRASLLPTDAVIPPSSNTTVDTLARSSRPSNIAAETTITPESDITVPQTSGSTKSPDTFTRDSASFKNPRSSYIIPTQPASSVNKSSTGIVIESRKNSIHLSKSRENSVLVTGDEDSVRQRASVPTTTHDASILTIDTFSTESGAQSRSRAGSVLGALIKRSRASSILVAAGVELTLTEVNEENMASSADGGFENPQEYARTVDSLNYDSYPVSTIDDISEFESISTISHLHQFRKSTLRSGQYFMLGDEWETSNRKPDRILTPQKPDLSILDMNKTVATVQKMKNARSLSSRPVVWMKDFVQAMDKTFEVLDDTRRPKTAAEIFRAIELGNFDNRPFTSDAFREPTLSRAAEQPQDVLLPPILSSSSFNTMQKNARKLVKADGKVPLKPRMSSAVQRIVSVMTSHDDSSVAASTAITKVNVITNTPKIHWKRAESSGRLARMDYKAFGVSIVNADDVAQVTSALLLNKKSEPPKSKRNVKRTVQSGTISQFYDIAVELDSISALDTKTCDGWSDSDPSELKSESRSLQIKLVIQNQIDEAPQTMHHREPNHFLPPCIVCPSKMSISAKKVNTFTSIDPILLKPPRKKRSNNLASNHVSAHRRDSLAFQVDRQPFKVYKDDVDPCEPVKQLPELKRNQDKGQPARVEAKGIKYIQSLMKKVGRRGKYAVQHYEYEQNEQREVAIKTIEVPVVATAKKCQNLISSARNQPLTSKQGVLRNLASNLFNHQSSHSQCEAENETEKNLIVSQSSTFKVKGISPQGLTLRGSTVGLKPRSSDVGGVESLRDSFFLVPDIRQPSVEDFSLFINAPEGSPITDSEYSGYPIEINVRTPSTVSTGFATGFDTRSDFGTSAVDLTVSEASSTISNPSPWIPPPSRAQSASRSKATLSLDTSVQLSSSEGLSRQSTTATNPSQRPNSGELSHQSNFNHLSARPSTQRPRSGMLSRQPSSTNLTVNTPAQRPRSATCSNSSRSSVNDNTSRTKSFNSAAISRQNSKFTAAFSMVHYEDNQAKAVRIKLPFKKHHKAESWLQLMIEHAFLIYQSIRRIQRVWRGCLTYKQFRRRRVAAKTIQRFFRVFMIRRVYRLAQELVRLKASTASHRLTAVSQNMLDTHVKEMKLLSRNIASANEDAVYELDANDEPISTNLNVREAMRRYVALKHIPVPQASRDFDPQVTQMWDQFGIFFLQSVSRFLNSKSLSLTMHLSGSYGRGFKRVHVSSIIETVQEKIPGLLKLPKHGKVKIIAGLLAQEEADDDVDEV